MASAKRNNPHILLLVALFISWTSPLWCADSPKPPAPMQLPKEGFHYDHIENQTDPLIGTTVQVPPEVSTRVFLSNSDVNRIICPASSVQDVVYSQEKGLTAQIKGNNVFVKYLVQQDPTTKDLEYASIPTELFIVCGGGDVYTILAIPKKIPTQTIQLVQTKDKLKKNISIFTGMPLEKKVSMMIKNALTETYPDSFTKTAVNEKFEVSKQINVVLRNKITIDGEGLLLKEYVITLKPEFKGSFAMDEKMFVIPTLASRPVAVSLSKMSVEDGKTVRLFIVEKKNEE